MSRPLADSVRPQTLDEVVGQKHLLGEGKLLRNIIESNRIPNMIFYGPSGVGKTTVANIIAAKTGKTLHKLNATNASVSDIKDIIASLGSFMTANGVLLYLDEIQHFNKKQQQSLLEFIENGSITLIASTTENPYFYVYNAVISRSVVFEFESVSDEEIVCALGNVISRLEKNEYSDYKIDIEPSALLHIAAMAAGDVRKAINSLEIILLATTADAEGRIRITLDAAEQATNRKALRHDRDGDSHYDLLSALQKSIRGSDPDAAVYYLARLLAGGDFITAARRIQVCASEDIGLAYPQAVVITNACVEAAYRLGMPEARIPLAEAVIMLATAPKSNSAISAIDAAEADLAAGDTGNVPTHLRDAHYQGAQKLGHGQDYRYPHSFPNNYVEQQYLPDKIKDRVYYQYGSNKTEQAAKAYWDLIKTDNRKG